MALAPKTDYPDHAGLQSAQPYDAPEVVPEFQRPPPIEHNSSQHSPQAYLSDRKQQDYYGGQPDVRAHYAQPPPVLESDAKQLNQRSSSQKRICGLSRKVFFWILALVILLIVIAAVLGGVLGTLLGDHGSGSTSNSSGSTNSPESSNSTGSAITLPSIESNTGLAVIRLGDTSTTYVYAQDGQGRIYENAFSDGKWSIEGDVIPSNAIIATDAQSGSPIAATSWSSSGGLFRQVFYLDQNGLVMTSNTTGTNSWPTPFNVLTGDAAAPGTKALAVVSDTNGDALNGIRVYFASSSEGIIREVGTDFDPNDPTWYMWATFAGSDMHSGVATVVANDINHLYLRDSSNGDLQQWTWDYTQNDHTSWQRGTRSRTNITAGSDIAATYDGFSTDYIFYQDANDQLIRALYYGQQITDLEEIAVIKADSKLSATYGSSHSNDGAMVFYQNATNTKAISYETVNRSGDKLLSGTVE